MSVVRRQRAAALWIPFALVAASTVIASSVQKIEGRAHVMKRWVLRSVMPCRSSRSGIPSWEKSELSDFGAAHNAITSFSSIRWTTCPQPSCRVSDIAAKSGRLRSDSGRGSTSRRSVGACNAGKTVGGRAWGGIVASAFAERRLWLARRVPDGPGLRRGVRQRSLCVCVCGSMAILSRAPESDRNRFAVYGADVEKHAATEPAPENSVGCDEWEGILLAFAVRGPTGSVVLARQPRAAVDSMALSEVRLGTL
ncbi:hypothetical protein HPB50_023993 [Hyalomma asiaticum]|uniref:Uncharacterized protein n=1 Tax=Hyalomma asiaticum TaxID=266040 RepID=A0ACB7S9E4_HYAAI|nr:hypothetical protein HPB50_023993 [Hyalomma asiaticum]